MAEMPQGKNFPHSPFVPYDPIVQFYETEAWAFGGDAEAWEYTGWRDEVLAATTTSRCTVTSTPRPHCV